MGLRRSQYHGMKAALKAADKEDMLNQQILSLSIEWYLLLQGEYKAVEKVDRMFGQVASTKRRIRCIGEH
jgi:hypothetical protein